MDREEFARRIGGKIKLIRTEYGLSQDVMSDIIGVSKKTLCDTEKGNRTLSWTEAVAVTSIFSKSEILQSEFGGEQFEMIEALAFDSRKIKYPSTMGGKIWWKTVFEHEEYQIQQNIISGHYRLLDGQNRRMISSFDLERVKDYLYSIIK